jgi:hypothetical protein
MILHSYLMSTSICFISGAMCLVLASCGSESENGGAGSSYTPDPNQQADFRVTNKAVFVAFNGFDGDASVYQATPLNLAGDLSVSQAENLYDYNTFKTNVGTKDNLSGVTAATYTRKLPKSGQTIKTALTVLNPDLAMHNSINPNHIKPSTNNPVVLSIPAGLALRPEAPFFPAGTKYSGVLVEAPSDPAENHGCILSIEASATPLQFAAFSHQEGKNFTLRTYDNNSTIDTSSARPLLTMAKSTATIKSRFVSLTADRLSDSNISLDSMNMTALRELGFRSGKDLLAIIPSVFPRVYNTTKQDTIFNANYGVFCLGGKNTFKQVDLSNQTFLYPVSAKNKNTKIATVKVSSDSGIITESGKYVEITTLTGQGDLKLITVMKDAATADPIVKTTTLNGVTKINVVVGLVDPAFKLPGTGVTLLSSDSGLAGIRICLHRAVKIE